MPSLGSKEPVGFILITMYADDHGSVRVIHERFKFIEEVRAAVADKEYVHEVINRHCYELRREIKV